MDTTFSLDVSSPGAADLRHTVMIKLSELMGSSTDEVLAEYVVVLVGHGKQRAQAVKDLQAFLGDQSEAFVTWLWDHLCSNIHMYTSVPKSSSPKEGSGGTEQLVEDKREESIENIHAHERPDVKKAEQPSIVKHERKRSAGFNKDPGKTGNVKSASLSWRERTGLRSGEIENERTVTNEMSQGYGSRHSTKRPRSPDSWTVGERDVSDERCNHKRQLSPPRVNATRRLLQSAVREAVAPLTSHSKRAEISSKRLRSVVENPENIADASVQRPFKSVARPDAVRKVKKSVPALAVAMKAAAAAAEDAARVRRRLTGNIWNRIGKGRDSKEQGVYNLVARDGHVDTEALESRFVGTSWHISDRKPQKRTRLGSSDMSSNDSTEDAAAVSDPMIDEYTSAQLTGGRSICAIRGGKYQRDEMNHDSFARTLNQNEGQQLRAKDRLDESREESVTVQYRLAQNMKGDVKEAHKQKGLNASSGLANASQKIVNISVNVNTWKPRPYETLDDTADSEQPMIASASKPLQLQVDKNAAVDMPQAHDQSELEEENYSDQHVTEMKKRMCQVQLEMNKLRARQSEVTKEVQKSTSVTISGTKRAHKCQDDADTRTVFVTNIHFAAAKESLAAHFTQCGDIERIVMLTDGATGLPKGSAYIEFSMKAAADKALTLNESSFYSRVLKVVRKDAAIQAIHETNPLLVHPTVIRHSIPLPLRLPLRGRVVRPSPYLLPRIPSRIRPYGSFPNLHWKRAGVTSGSSMNPTLLSGSRPGYGLPMRPARSLSYIRGPKNPATQILGLTEKQKVIPQQGGNDVINPDLEGRLAQEHKDDMETLQSELEKVGGAE